MLGNKIFYDITRLAIQIVKIQETINLIFPLSKQKIDEISPYVTEILSIFPLSNIEKLPENNIDAIMLNYSNESLRGFVEELNQLSAILKKKRK
ncbi:MAG: hypothetical protein V1850_04850, partial [Candidatus Bathyarchaeota archaeon]